MVSLYVLDGCGEAGTIEPSLGLELPSVLSPKGTHAIHTTNGHSNFGSRGNVELVRDGPVRQHDGCAEWEGIIRGRLHLLSLSTQGSNKSTYNFGDLRQYRV
jgi:hypothetical protein